MKNKNYLKKEVRNADLQEVIADSNDSNELRLTGHAAVFERSTVLFEYEGVQYKEVISRDAFNGTDMSKCCLKYNHSDGVPVMARVKGGSLSLEIDNIGLKFDARLFDTQTSRDIYSIVKQGGIDKCSFAFTVEEDEYDRATHTRTIKKIGKLLDVSVVDVPAYDDTDVSARDYFNSEEEKYKTLERENQRKRAILKLKLSL